jgi:hypothetical protein
MFQQTIQLPTAKSVLWTESGREGGSAPCTLAIDLLGYNDEFVQLIGIPCEAPDNPLHVFVRSYLLEEPHTMVIPAFCYDARDGLVRYDVRLTFERTADQLLVEEALSEMLAHRAK